MAEVKWIKITTNMFDDEKIKLIEAMPDKDAILIIWVKLLVQAGKCNASGYLLLNQNFPYTDEMLSTVFNRPLNTIRMALETFKSFGMIDFDDNSFYIANWEKHQNVEGLEKIREQTRKRVSEHRTKQKALSSNVTCNATVTQTNATDLELDLDLELEEEKEKDIKSKKKESIPKKTPAPPKPTKNKFGEYGNVLLASEELEKLQTKYPNTDELIKHLDEYIEMKGYKAKSHYLTIIKWVVNAVEEQKTKSRGKQAATTKEEESSNIFDKIGKDRGYW